MLWGMVPPAKRTPRGNSTDGRGRSSAKTGARRAPATKASTSGSTGESFPVAFAALLRARKLPVPKGLTEVPPEAYASQPASFVAQLEQLPDAELRRFAAKIATHVERQAERAQREWDSSPLIAELRRRRLAEPPAPKRPTGVSVSLAKPLAKWSDKEILKAARDWSKLGDR